MATSQLSDASVPVAACWIRLLTQVLSGIAIANANPLAGRDRSSLPFQGQQFPPASVPTRFVANPASAQSASKAR
jgi:hypothetical protein